MPPGKKLGYNWKARQSRRSEPSNRTRETVASGDAVSAQEVRYGDACDWDTNALVLPKKRAKLEPAEAINAHKKKKLSTKQRKRLQKIVEAKEMKAKV